jgi:hypothetical protein
VLSGELKRRPELIDLNLLIAYHHLAHPRDCDEGGEDFIVKKQLKSHYPN